MSEEYNNPPIVEVVCECRLTRDSTWDLATPGLIYEEVREKFPNKERHQTPDVKSPAGQQGMPQQEPHSLEYVQFYTDDKKAYIQVAPHLVSLNCLKPYPRWEGFRPMIETVFDAMVNTINVIGFERIGLRYINRIEIPRKSFSLDDYFDFRPFLSKKLPRDMTNFFVGCIFPYSHDRDLCKVQLTMVAPEKPECVAFILDLDYYLARPDTVSINQAMDWVEEAHEHVKELFEGCIKDNLRTLFQK
jgi:uncharacterized protein (TIGR04255 family)